MVTVMYVTGFKWGNAYKALSMWKWLLLLFPSLMTVTEHPSLLSWHQCWGHKVILWEVRLEGNTTSPVPWSKHTFVWLYLLGIGMTVVQMIEPVQDLKFQEKGKYNLPGCNKQLVNLWMDSLPCFHLCYSNVAHRPEHQHHLGTSWKCRISSPTPTYWIRILPRSSLVCTHIKVWKVLL